MTVLKIRNFDGLLNQTSSKNIGELRQHRKTSKKNCDNS